MSSSWCVSAKDVFFGEQPRSLAGSLEQATLATPGSPAMHDKAGFRASQWDLKYPNVPTVDLGSFALYSVVIRGARSDIVLGYLVATSSEPTRACNDATTRFGEGLLQHRLGWHPRCPRGPTRQRTNRCLRRSAGMSAWQPFRHGACVDFHREVRWNTHVRWVLLEAKSAMDCGEAIGNPER